MAAVRNTWMFRTAAFVFLFFGLVWLWRFTLTAYHPEQRPYGIAAGIAAVLIGVFVFRRQRVAIGASAAVAALVALAAVVFAPSARGPVILFLAMLALACGTYAVLAVRALTTREP